MNKSVSGVQPKLMQLLVSRDWQGEVRELENFIERLMIFASGDELTAQSLPTESIHTLRNIDVKKATSLKRAIEQYERYYIIEQLAKHQYHRGNTAEALGISEATLYRKMNQLKIEDMQSE